MKAFSPEPGSVLTDRIIRLGIKVHRTLGPGLLEFVYHQCLCWELRHNNLAFKREVPLTVVYEDMRLERAYHADIIVEQSVLLELKTVERILPVHEGADADLSAAQWLRGWSADEFQWSHTQGRASPIYPLTGLGQ